MTKAIPSTFFPYKNLRGKRVSDAPLLKGEPACKLPRTPGPSPGAYLASIWFFSQRPPGPTPGHTAPGFPYQPLPGSTPAANLARHLALTWPPSPPLPPGPIPSPSPGRDGDLQALWVINVVEFLCRLHLDLKTGQHWGRDGTSRLSALGLALGAPTLTPSSSYRTPSPRTQQRIPAAGHLHSGLLSSTALYCGESR